MKIKSRMNERPILQGSPARIQVGGENGEWRMENCVSVRASFGERHGHDEAVEPRAGLRRALP